MHVVVPFVICLEKFKINNFRSEMLGNWTGVSVCVIQIIS